MKFARIASVAATFSILVTLTSLASSAKVDDGAVTTGEAGKAIIISYEQLFDLPNSMRADYIRALRLALVEIEADQRKDKTITGWLSLFPEALAAGEVANQCVFAGWIGTFSAPVDGHRYCHAPSEALAGCGAGEIKCSPIIFGDNLCVKKDTYATSTCDLKAPPSEDVAKTYFSNADLKKNWDQMANSVDNICAITTRQQSPCAKIEKRLDAVKKRNPIPAAAKPSASGQTGSQVAATGDKTPCKKTREKGGAEWGTCHAFCTLCTLDRLAAKHHFRTSANWVVFLSAVDRVCNPGSNKPIITNPTQLFKEAVTGGDMKFDFDWTVKYGFCDEETYLPYSDEEPPQPNGQKVEQGLNVHKIGSATAFEGQFGISFDNLKKLYCPDGFVTDKLTRDDPDYEARLQKLGPDIGRTSGGQKFMKCAQDSLAIAKQIKHSDNSLCSVKTADAPQGQAIDPDILKRALSAHLPVAAEITSPNPREAPHCVTLTGFENGRDGRPAFDIINFHGDGLGPDLYSNDPIKFTDDDKGRKIISYSYVDCQQAAPAGPAPTSSSEQSGRRHGIH